MNEQNQDKSKKDKKTAPLADQIIALQGQLQSLQKEKDDLFAKMQRLGADYDNYQKRVPKQIADAISLEKEAIIKSLLTTLDNLEHTLAGASSAGSVEAVIKGVQIVYDQLLAAMKLLGVEQIKALGLNFDPACHHALTQRAEKDKQDNVVVEQLQTGYKLNGRVVRPARVVVNKLPQEQTPPEEPETKDTQ